METLYKELHISRQAIWKHQKATNAKKESESAIIQDVKCWRKKHPSMGSRQLFHSMKNDGCDLKIGINKFENLLKKNNLTIGKVRSKKPKTSDGKGKEDYPNLTNGLILNDINQLLVADITYYWVDDAWHYLFTLKDVYSQRILDLVPSKNMTSENALKCIRTANKIRGKGALVNCIHHTDNGSQYNANNYKKILTEELGMKISRAETCEQNGSSEQFNHIVKNMYFEGWGIETYKQLVPACKDFLHLNNNERAIKQLGNLSPIVFEKSLKSIPLELRIKKTLHDFETK
jgi:putative transposase